MPGRLWIYVGVSAFTIRSCFVGIRLDPDSVTYVGFLRSRRIPRKAIHGMTTFPSLLWIDSRARKRRTPVFAFMYNRNSIGSYDEEIQNHKEKVEQIRKALKLPRIQ